MNLCKLFFENKRNLLSFSPLLFKYLIVKELEPLCCENVTENTYGSLLTTEEGNGEHKERPYMQF